MPCGHQAECLPFRDLARDKYIRPHAFKGRIHPRQSWLEAKFGNKATCIERLLGNLDEGHLIMSHAPIASDSTRRIQRDLGVAQN